MKLQEYRIQRIRNEAKKADVSAVVATSPINVRYLTGYCGMLENFQHESFNYVLYDVEKDRFIYIASLGEVPTILEYDINAEVFSSGGLFYEYCSGDVMSDRVEIIRQQRYSSMGEALAAAINTTMGTVAIDESCMNFINFEKINAMTPNHPLVSAYDIFMGARSIKHPEEIEGIKKVAVIAEKALMEALKSFKAGVTTELDLAREYNENVVKLGALPLFFVATSGHRAAFCDTVTTAKVIEEGEVIRFDFGCILNGYRSDIARTAVVCAPTEKVATYYHAVKEGTHKAVEAMKPGVALKDIFNIAQETVRQNGIPHYRRNHVGHGIGLEMYDIPSITSDNDKTLEENMVFCVETPYYELGWGGVQVEDTVVITKDGAEYLDPPSGELIILK